MTRNEKYICYIGRPSYQKNSLFFVEVANEVQKHYPNIKFLMLGVGYYSPDLESVKDMISKYKLENTVELLPWLNHAETLEYVKNSLLYLTVARYEGLPLAVLEAMALGKCIVASNVIGNKDCVIDNYNGRLLQLEINIFARTICNLIENTELRIKYGNNSRKLFEEKFLIKRKIKELEAIYQIAIQYGKNN